jgi:hypothetical protein
LIGLCIEQGGRSDREDVVCDLDARFVGGALDAAEDHELLGRRE